jgi:3'-5' exoribonuclease
MNDKVEEYPKINELQIGSTIMGFYLVDKKQILQTKTGNDYLKLYLMDNTGKIPAIMWDKFEDDVETFGKDDVIKVQAQVQLHQNRPQLRIFRLRLADKEEYKEDNFYPQSDYDVDKLLDFLIEVRETIENEYMKKLLGILFEDNELMTKFKMAPGGKALHHVNRGGLIEHVSSVVRVCEFMAGYYKRIDRELLITSAIFHDIGKVDELTYEKSFDYSDEGRLLGHIVEGVIILDRMISKIPDFPEKLSLVLKHIIISHHGYFEYGSPKLPMILEALVLHYIEDLDAKINSFTMWLDDQVDLENPNWTKYWSLYDRFLYRWEKSNSIPEDIDKDNNSEQDLNQ